MCKQQSLPVKDIPSFSCSVFCTDMEYTGLLNEIMSSALVFCLKALTINSMSGPSTCVSCLKDSMSKLDRLRSNLAGKSGLVRSLRFNSSFLANLKDTKVVVILNHARNIVVIGV